MAENAEITVISVGAYFFRSNLEADRIFNLRGTRDSRILAAYFSESLVLVRDFSFNRLFTKAAMQKLSWFSSTTAMMDILGNQAADVKVWI